MGKRFRTGDLIQIGNRKENIALVLGPAFRDDVAGGMWWAHVIATGRPIMVFQSSIIRVVA